MFIRLVSVKGSGKTYRYAQLVESFRRSPDSRPTHRVLANLGQLSDEEVGVLPSDNYSSPVATITLPHPE
jgi:hypothetical protein